MPSHQDADHSGHHSRSYWSLVMGSIGVVFGDIGTSPLYALHEAVHAAHVAGIADTDAVIGVVSLILWALTLIVTLKYVMLLLWADNRGEGGTFALMALGQAVAKRSAVLLFWLGVAGAAFFYGDAVITPAISVLSAVEGLKLVSPHFDAYVIPISLGILIALFMSQSHGTARVASFFGPITAVWFVVMALGGLSHLLDTPIILRALNPIEGIVFAATHGITGLTVMGLVFLAVTGAEALYADLGHFGRRPISFAWTWLVFPSLALNYLGQGALVITDPTALENPFFRLYPDWALIPMVCLATCATVIASQAVITGAFSLTRQAVQLGLIPRLAIRHTSEEMAGQIYMPRVNHILLVGVILIVLAFRDSSHLAAAYGVSVTATMVITSVMAFFVIWKRWNWPLWRTAAIILPLLAIEQVFFTANALKILEGGWLPLSLAALVILIVATWTRGYRILQKATRKTEADIDWLEKKLEAKPPLRTTGTAVFFSADGNSAPLSLMNNLKHNRVLHERNIILSLKTEDIPHVSAADRIRIDRSNETFLRVFAHYGFMETPSIPRIVEQCRRKGLNIDLGSTSFFLSRRTLRSTSKSELPRWQAAVFMALLRSAEDATTYYQIPIDRVVEVGTQITV